MQICGKIWGHLVWYAYNNRGKTKRAATFTLWILPVLVEEIYKFMHLPDVCVNT